MSSKEVDLGMSVYKHIQSKLSGRFLAVKQVMEELCAKFPNIEDSNKISSEALAAIESHAKDSAKFFNVGYDVSARVTELIGNKKGGRG
jgi:hypothetical protein